MPKASDEEIRKSREMLGNPYAHLDGDWGYSALSSLPEDVHEARRKLENPYAYLREDGAFDHPPSTRGEQRRLEMVDPDRLLAPKARDQDFSKKEIRRIVRRIQAELWRQRTSIQRDGDQTDPLGVLDPSIALKVIGYRFDLEESLGQYSSGRETFEIAGVIDRAKRRVAVSRRFSPEIRNFTTAHELGHAVLHGTSELHRDRALDGTRADRAREPQEIEADIFAAFFLMPEKPVKAEFEMRFLTQNFVMNEDTAFALLSDGLDALQKRCRTSRDLSILLARAEQYDGKHFYSLAQRFGVSAEAMAIRIEELGLVAA